MSRYPGFSHSPTRDPAAIEFARDVMDFLQETNEGFRRDKDASPEALIEDWRYARAVLAVMMNEGYRRIGPLVETADRAIERLEEMCADAAGRRRN